MGKICTKCKKEKPESEFYKDSQKKSGLTSSCKICNSKRSTDYAKRNRKKRNDSNMKYSTGISREQYDEILLEQGSCCVICGKTEAENGKRLSIDHDHKTSLVRGILCNKCNQGLGYFLDSKDLLGKAIKYLDNNISFKKIKYGYKKNSSTR